MRKAVIVGIYRAVPGRWQREPGGTRGVSLLSKWVLKTNLMMTIKRTELEVCFSIRGTCGGTRIMTETSFSLPRPWLSSLTVTHSGSQWRGLSGTFPWSYPLLPAPSLHTFPLFSMKMRLSWVWDLNVRRPPWPGVGLLKKGNQEWSLTSQTEIWKDLRPSAEYFESPSKEYPLWFGTGYNLSRYLC